MAAQSLPQQADLRARGLEIDLLLGQGDRVGLGDGDLLVLTALGDDEAERQEDDDDGDAELGRIRALAPAVVAEISPWSSRLRRQ
jgi:hypothetical protein